MSKLADAIKRSQRIEAAPMGFGAARPATKPSMLVGYRGGADKVEGAAQAGAELLLVDSGSDVSRLKQAREQTGTAPLGAFGASKDAATTKSLREAGLDFLAFEADSTPAAALLDDDIGYLLVLPNDPEELFLRALEPLQLDAIFLPKVSTPLSVADQIKVGSVGQLARKPLIVQVKADASSEDLQCLRAAGVVAVVVEGESEGVTKLKETVASLPARKQRRDDRPVVSLPRGQVPVEDDDDDGD
jgi:hypothetical protein